MYSRECLVLLLHWSQSHCWHDLRRYSICFFFVPNPNKVARDYKSLCWIMWNGVKTFNEHLAKCNGNAWETQTDGVLWRAISIINIPLAGLDNDHLHPLRISCNVGYWCIMTLNIPVAMRSFPTELIRNRNVWLAGLHEQHMTNWTFTSPPLMHHNPVASYVCTTEGSLLTTTNCDLRNECSHLSDSVTREHYCISFSMAVSLWRIGLQRNDQGVYHRVNSCLPIFEHNSFWSKYVLCIFVPIK